MAQAVCQLATNDLLLLGNHVRRTKQDFNRLSKTACHVSSNLLSRKTPNISDEVRGTMSNHPATRDIISLDLQYWYLTKQKRGQHFTGSG